MSEVMFRWVIGVLILILMAVMGYVVTQISGMNGKIEILNNQATTIAAKMNVRLK